MQYQESLLAYQELSKKDHRACFTMLYCMHDYLIREFDACPKAKNMWDQLKIHFGYIFERRLCTLLLKWMQLNIDSSRALTDHLPTMSAIIRDLNVTGTKISEGEQVWNVI